MFHGIYRSLVINKLTHQQLNLWWRLSSILSTNLSSASLGQPVLSTSTTKPVADWLQQRLILWHGWWLFVMQIAAVNASPLLFRSLVPKSSALNIQSREREDWQEEKTQVRVLCKAMHHRTAALLVGVFRGRKIPISNQFHEQHTLVLHSLWGREAASTDLCTMQCTCFLLVCKTVPSWRTCLMLISTALHRGRERIGTEGGRDSATYGKMPAWRICIASRLFEWLHDDSDGRSWWPLGNGGRGFSVRIQILLPRVRDKQRLLQLRG